MVEKGTFKTSSVNFPHGLYERIRRDSKNEYRCFGHQVVMLLEFAYKVMDDKNKKG